MGKDTTADQLQTGYIFDHILKPTLPKDAVVMIALCDKDLFPDENYNYVFGQARLKDRVGVWSFFRFGNAGNAEEFPLVLKRTLKTASHETGHMFSLKHCAQYTCIMNGSNHLEEADRKPTGFCVDCLEKFCWNLGTEPQEYYQRLLVFWNRLNDREEAKRCEVYLNALGQQ